MSTNLRVAPRPSKALLLVALIAPLTAACGPSLRAPKGPLVTRQGPYGTHVELAGWFEADFPGPVEDKITPKVQTPYGPVQMRGFTTAAPHGIAIVYVMQSAWGWNAPKDEVAAALVRAARAGSRVVTGERIVEFGYEGAEMLITTAPRTWVNGADRELPCRARVFVDETRALVGLFCHDEDGEVFDAAARRFHPLQPLF